MEFTYMNLVTITKGFYQGQRGYVIETVKWPFLERRYLVSWDMWSMAEWFKESELD